MGPARKHHIMHYVVLSHDDVTNPQPPLAPDVIYSSLDYSNVVLIRAQTRVWNRVNVEL